MQQHVTGVSFGYTQTETSDHKNIQSIIFFYSVYIASDKDLYNKAADMFLGDTEEKQEESTEESRGGDDQLIQDKTSNQDTDDERFV